MLRLPWLTVAPFRKISLTEVEPVYPPLFAVGGYTPSFDFDQQQTSICIALVLKALILNDMQSY